MNTTPKNRAIKGAKPTTTKPTVDIDLDRLERAIIAALVLTGHPVEKSASAAREVAWLTKEKLIDLAAAKAA